MNIVGVFRRGRKAYGELRERDKLPLSLQGGVLAEWIMEQVKRRREAREPEVELRVSHAGDVISAESAKNFAQGFVNRIGRRGGFAIEHLVERSHFNSDWVEQGLRREVAGKIVVRVRIGPRQEIGAVAAAIGLGEERPHERTNAAGLFVRVAESSKSLHLMTSSRFEGQHIQRISLVGRG